MSPGWRPGDLPGDLATCWRPGDLLATCGCQAHTPRLATLLATHWRPLATAGDLATWRPGDLATCWRPAGDFCWRPGDPGLNFAFRFFLTPREYVGASSCRRRFSSRSCVSVGRRNIRSNPVSVVVLSACSRRCSSARCSSVSPHTLRAPLTFLIGSASRWTSAITLHCGPTQCLRSLSSTSAGTSAIGTECVNRATPTMAAGMSLLLSALLCRATHPAGIVKCRFSTGFSPAKICSLRVEPFSVIAWVISVRAGADVPPGRARAAILPAGPRRAGRTRVVPG